MARYSIAGIHLEMYHSLLQVNFGSLFPEDKALMFCPDCPRPKALLSGPCSQHGIESLRLVATDGLVDHCILYRRGPVPYRFRL